MNVGEWLKDKKNLPIVAGLLAVVLLAAGGLVAFELGLFPSGPSAAVAPAAPAPVGLRRPPGLAPPGLPPLGLPPPGLPVAAAHAPGAPVASALAAKGPVAENPDTVNPTVGPDPFYIRGGQKRLAANTPPVADTKLPLREIVGPLNLFRIHPPAPPPPPVVEGIGQADGTSPTSNYHLIGVITGSDGINAILQVGDQSQSVKPGDALPDGSRVNDIQTNSLTLRTPAGSLISLPLSAGSPDQGANALNGPQPFGGPPPFNNNQ